MPGKFSLLMRSEGLVWTKIRKHFSAAEWKEIYGACSKDAVDCLAEDMGWPEIHAFNAELKRGQDIYEDGGGYFRRCILALMGRPSKTVVENYQDAFKRLAAEHEGREATSYVIRHKPTNLFTGSDEDFTDMDDANQFDSRSEAQEHIKYHVNPANEFEVVENVNSTPKGLSDE